MIKVEADTERCEGHGNCIAIAPTIYTLNDDGIVQLLSSEVPDSQRAEVIEAIVSCPAAALSLHEVE